MACAVHQSLYHCYCCDNCTLLALTHRPLFLSFSLSSLFVPPSPTMVQPTMVPPTMPPPPIPPTPPRPRVPTDPLANASTKAPTPMLPPRLPLQCSHQGPHQCSHYNAPTKAPTAMLPPRPPPMLPPRRPPRHHQCAHRRCSDLEAPTTRSPPKPPPMLPPKKVLPLTMLHAAAKLHIFKRSSSLLSCSCSGPCRLPTAGSQQSVLQPQAPAPPAPTPPTHHPPPTGHRSRSPTADGGRCTVLPVPQPPLAPTATASAIRTPHRSAAPAPPPPTGHRCPYRVPQPPAAPRPH